MNKALFVASVIVVVTAIYCPLSRYSYVQDDKMWINYFITNPVQTVILESVAPAEKIFYRPLGEIYLWMMWSIFGMSTVWFHVFAMATLCGSAYLTMLIAKELTDDNAIAWCSGLLFAVAVQCHFDAQIWMVGIFDNGATFFALLYMVLFLRNRYVAAALTLIIALGFKESAILAPVVMIVYMFLVGRKGELLKNLWPQAFVVAGWLANKFLGATMFGLPSSDIYAMRWDGTNAVNNTLMYLTWTVHYPFYLVYAILFAVLVVYRKKVKILPVLLIWIVLAVLPATAFLHHAYHYYVMFAVPAVSIAALIAITSIVGKGKYATILCTLFVIAHLVFAIIFVNGHVSKGMFDDIPARDDGYNHLIRKAILNQ